MYIVCSSCLPDLHETGWNFCLGLHPCKSCAFGHLNAKPYFSPSYLQIFSLSRSFADHCAGSFIIDGLKAKSGLAT